MATSPEGHRGLTFIECFALGELPIPVHRIVSLSTQRLESAY